MARWSAARWNPVSQYSGTLRPIAVTLHHQAGNGDPASIYQSRGVSAHFWIPYQGGPVQHVDTANRAWHGGTDALNSNCIGVETEGCGSAPHADPLNENQLNWFAELMKWANAVHGVPLVLSEAATTPGLNYHRCQGGFNTACPCDVRKNARTEILRRAMGGAPSRPEPPPPKPDPNQMRTESETMTSLYVNGTFHVWKDENGRTVHYWQVNPAPAGDKEPYKWWSEVLPKAA